MASNSQYQNPNPNLHEEITNLDDSYSEVLNYFNFEDGSGDNIFMENEQVVPAKNVVDESSNLSQVAKSGNMQVPIRVHGRREKYYKAKGEFKFVFRTKSAMEFMDDGFRWRKYGKKMIKNNPNPRHYFKCSVGGCNVKKRVERDREDPSYVITSYEGVHNH